MKLKLASLMSGTLPGQILQKLPEAEVTYFTEPQNLLLKVRLGHFDLLILEDAKQIDQPLHRFVERYSLPVILKNSSEETAHGPGVLTETGFESLSPQALRILLETYRERRTLQRKQATLRLLQRFEKALPVVQSDEFLVRLKSFLLEELPMESCSLIRLEPGSGDVPRILATIQALESSKLDQKDLAQQLSHYKRQLVKQDFCEVWQDDSGQYLALLDLGRTKNEGPCLILNGLNQSAARRLRYGLHSLTHLIRTRWQLCLEVESYREQVFLDSLTGLHNQKSLYEVLNKKIEEYHRYKAPFSILFIDIDFFKHINDSKGHVVGSEVLRQLGSLIQQTVRTTDYAFRYGGDEFIVLLSHTIGDMAQMVAERIRSKIEKNLFPVGGENVHITVSIGLAFFPDHANSASEIIRIADEAMYYGKNHSRNIVYKAS